MTTADHLQTEAQYQDTLTAYADAQGWRWTHFRAAKTDKGFRTPLSGSPGFVDLVLVRGDRLIMAELKSQKGKMSEDQWEWARALAQVPGVEYYQWRPSDWDTVVEVLE
jgi:hypothetical protein